MVGDDDPIDAAPDRLAGVLQIEHAFEHQGPGPAFAHPIDILPGDRRIEVAPDPAPELIEGFELRRGGGDIAESVRPAIDLHIP